MPGKNFRLSFGISKLRFHSQKTGMCKRSHDFTMTAVYGYFNFLTTLFYAVITNALQGFVKDNFCNHIIIRRLPPPIDKICLKPCDDCQAGPGFSFRHGFYQPGGV